MTSHPLVVVQTDFVKPLTAPMAIACRERDIMLYDLPSTSLGRVNPLPSDEDWSPILVVGSVVFAQKWAQDHPDLKRWVFLDDSQYDAEVWADKLKGFYLNADGVATTVCDFIASDLGPHHIRPRSGIKMIGEPPATESSEGREAIAGLVASPDELANKQIDPTTPIWISKPKTIYAEVRHWIIDGILVESSTYRINGKGVFENYGHLIATAGQIAQLIHFIWRPGRHYVVDLALTHDGWKVIEYNSIHSSGWYAGEPGVILDAFMKVNHGE